MSPLVEPMHEASFARRPTAVVRFRGLGRAGVIRAFYGTTPRPVDSGFPVLPGWARETTAGVGFPTVKCEVVSSQPGYGSDLGWIQWVMQERPEKGKSVKLVDRLPAFLDRDIPFLTMGYAPTFFDAPAYNSLPVVDWRADLFLCTLPLLSRREAIHPLAGFRWGYHIDVQGAAPNHYPLVRATPSDWVRVRKELTALHPEWKFGKALRNLPRS